jgi:hypothetical protein
LAFLSILVVSFYGCQKEVVNNATKPQQIVESRGACTDPIFPSISASMTNRDLKGLRLFDYRYAVADSQPAAVNFSATYVKQAYKEEAIRMYISGYESKYNAADTYNVNNSPGKKYITGDGY